jgi:hypothetical protein
VRVSKSEMMWLCVLGAIVFLGANYFAYDFLSKQQKALDLSYHSLRADQAEAKVDLVETNLWKQRMAWVEANEPPLGNEGDAKAQVLEQVLKGARDNNLEIVEQSLNDVQHGPAGTQVNVTVKVKGSMQGLVKWMTAFQKPDQFFAVSTFSLRADQDQKSMVCNLQIARFFKDK